jgi:hypothetical protein
MIYCCTIMGATENLCCSMLFTSRVDTALLPPMLLLLYTFAIMKVPDGCSRDTKELRFIRCVRTGTDTKQSMIVAKNRHRDIDWVDCSACRFYDDN